MGEFYKAFENNIFINISSCVRRTIASLQQSIYDYNKQFALLYPDIQFTPGLHYLYHFPNQIRMFGPERNHWCIRIEAKHRYLKKIKSRGIINHHQYLWLHIISSGCVYIRLIKSEIYLYPGDVGSTVNFINLKDVVRDTIQETSIS